MDINSLSRQYDPSLDDPDLYDEVPVQHFLQGGDVTDVNSSGGGLATDPGATVGPTTIPATDYTGVPTVTRATNYLNTAAIDPATYLDQTTEEGRLATLRARFGANALGFGTQQSSMNPVLQHGDAYKDPRNPYVMTLSIDPETGAPRNPNSYYGIDALPGSTAGPGNTHDPAPAREAAAQKMLADYTASVNSTPYRAPSRPQLPTTQDFINRTSKGLPGLGRKTTVAQYQDNPNYMPFEHDPTIRAFADGGAVGADAFDTPEERMAFTRANPGVNIIGYAGTNQDLTRAGIDTKGMSLDQMAAEMSKLYPGEKFKILAPEAPKATTPAASSYIYDQNDPNAVRIAQLTGHAPAPAATGLNMATATALMRKAMSGQGLSDAETAPYGGYVAVKKFWEQNGGTEANTLNTGAPPATGGTTPPAGGGTTTTAPKATDTLLPPSNPAYPGGGNTLVTQPNVTPPAPPIVSQTDIKDVTGTKVPGTTGTGVSVAPGTNIPFQPLPGTLQTTPAKADLTKFNNAYNNNQNLNSVMGYLPPGFSFDPSKYFQPSQAQNLIKASPNLTPQSLGQYQQTTDRMGNLIAIPTINPLTFQPFVRTMAEGGLVDDEEDREAAGAKEMLKGYEQLTGPRQTQVVNTPNRQSVRTRQASQIVDQRGRPAGMTMNTSSMTTAQGPASPEQMATAKAMLADLMRQNLTKRRFAGGGDVSNFKGGAPAKTGAPAKQEKEPEEPSLWNLRDYAAEASTKMFPKQTGADDQRDAARHMLAAGLAARKLGAGMAEFLGKAHERMSNPYSLFSMIGIGEPRYDYPVDVHNNKLGIDLASRAKTQGELEKMVKDLAKTSVNEQQPGRPWTVDPAVVEAIKEKQRKLAEGPPESRAEGSPEEGEVYTPPSNPFGRQAANQARQRAEIAERSRIAAAREKVARTPALDEAGGETTDEFIQRTMGFDPTVNEQRGTFLPQKIKRNGKTEWIAPNILKDALLPYNLSSQALTTSRFDPEKVPEAAMNLTLGSLALGKAPAGSLGMAVKVPGGQWRQAIKVTDPVTGETISGKPSNMSEYIARAMERVPEGRDDVREFIVNKLFPYLTKSLGTDKDPIRAAVLEGKVTDDSPLYYGMAPAFREYMLEPAREAQGLQAKIAATEPKIAQLRQAAQEARDRGLTAEADSAAAQLKALQKTLPYTDAEKRAFATKSEALQDFHRNYDTKTGISTKIISDPGEGGRANYALSQAAIDTMRNRLTEAGVRPEHQNVPSYVENVTLNEFAKKLFPDSEGHQQALIQGVRSGDPRYKQISDAITFNEPLYDLASNSGADIPGFKHQDIGQLLSEIPADKLKKMSAAEAFVTAFPTYQLTKDFKGLVEKIRSGAAYPKEALDLYLNRGLQPVKVPDTPGWYRVATPQAVQLEGAQMRHSVGGYGTSDTYNKGGRPAFNAGTTRVYSLRPQKNKPEVTLDVYDDPDTGLVKVHSIYGKENSNPSPYKEELFKLFDSIPNLDPMSLPRLYYGSRNNMEAGSVDWAREYLQARPNVEVPSQRSAPTSASAFPQRAAPGGNAWENVGQEDNLLRQVIDMVNNAPGNEAQMAARQRIRDRIAARNARRAAEGIPPVEEE